MQSSMFNLRVPLAGSDDATANVFLMNTLSGAQLVVSSDVAQLLERFRESESADDLEGDELDAVAVLSEQGFLVDDRAQDRAALDRFFARTTADGSELHITVLTTLQCNFACDTASRAITATTTSSRKRCRSRPRTTWRPGSSASSIACVPSGWS